MGDEIVLSERGKTTRFVMLGDGGHLAQNTWCNRVSMAMVVLYVSFLNNARYAWNGQTDWELDGLG